MNAARDQIVNEVEHVEKVIGNADSKSLLSSMIIPVLVTVLLVLFGAYLMNKHSLISSNNRSFLICGLPNSGKTNLFHLLTKGKLPVLTVSSIEPNKGQIVFNDPELHNQKTFQDIEIHDFPSNNKLKNLYLLPYLQDKINEVRGIIYLIDSSNFNAENCHLISEELLEILKITESQQNGIDLLIFANKNDLFTSKKTNKIREMLEKEISKIHALKLRGLNKINENEIQDDNLDLAIENGVFKFELLDANITFSDGNFFKNNFTDIYDWLYEKIVN